MISRGRPGGNATSPHFSHVWTDWGRRPEFSPAINVLREVGHDSGKNSLFFNPSCLSRLATRKCLTAQTNLQCNLRSSMSVRNPGLVALAYWGHRCPAVQQKPLFSGKLCLTECGPNLMIAGRYI